ncbi:unnamed protein product [Symbiodinium sp. CCMP2592]|nr:unnamed protein product [Symbiodinium sp. CCMP2592]
MGRRDKNKSKESWDGQGRNPSAYSLWRGAYSSPSGRNPKAWKDYSGWEGTTPTFPAFDAGGYSNAPPPPAAEPKEYGPGEYLNVFQQALNHARRAEQKVARMEGARKKMEQQWAQYEKSALEAFAREKLRYKQKMQKLASDLREAEAAQDQACQGLREVHLVDARQARPVVMETELVDAETADLFARAGDVQSDWQGILARALRSSQPACTPTRPPTTAPRSPRTEPQSSAPRTAGMDAHQGVEAFARHDPYHLQAAPSPPMVNTASAGQPPGLSPQIPKPPGHHPGQRVMEEPRVPTSTAPPRMGIKEATMAPKPPEAQHSQLSERLQEKRQRAAAEQNPVGRAMHPFGIPQALHPQLPPEMSNFLDDDEDDADLAHELSAEEIARLTAGRVSSYTTELADCGVRTPQGPRSGVGCCMAMYPSVNAILVGVSLSVPVELNGFTAT